MSDDASNALATEQVVARIRRLMLVSLSFTILAVAIVLGIVAYRVSRSEGSGPAAEVTAALPKGARVVQTAVAADRLVVTVEVGNAIEVRTYDLRTLRPTGRLGFVSGP